jgi:N12 class adenine-specific DNA methylase
MGVWELRRLGLITKPAIALPNHLVGQFRNEFLQLYPQAVRRLVCAPRCRSSSTAMLLFGSCRQYMRHTNVLVAGARWPRAAPVRAHFSPVA